MGSGGEELKMEQERQKREGENSADYQTPNMPMLCANSCGFFGNSSTNNLCSKCYKDLVLSKSKTVEVESIILPLVEKEKVVVDAEMGKLFEVGDASSVATTINDGDGGLVVQEEDKLTTTKTKKKPTNRCSFCNKKVGLMGFKCRCDEVFCSSHRYSDKHNCVFDYKGTAQDAIARANPVVKADKVEKI